MEKCNIDKKSSYIMYLDANNLYGWAMSQKLPVYGFKWKQNTSKFNASLIKNYDEDSDNRYFLKVAIKYPKDLHGLHSDSPFLPEKMKTNKCNKLVSNLYDKKSCVFHIRILK